jgi:hypothetical protein
MQQNTLTTTIRPKIRLSENLIVSAVKKLLGEDKFISTPQTTELYRTLAEYFNNDPDFEKRSLKAANIEIPFSFKKGILLLGRPGTGKSFIFQRLFKRFIRPCAHITAYDIQQMYTTGGIKAHLEWESGFKLFDDNRIRIPVEPIEFNVYVDDFGREQKSCKHFGTELHFMDVFIDRRDVIMTYSGAKTFATTNLKINELKEYYSDKTYSRFFKLFNFINLNSDNDFRIEKK